MSKYALKKAAQKLGKAYPDTAKMKTVLALYLPEDHEAIIERMRKLWEAGE